MSLRHFHLVFIAASLLLMGFLLSFARSHGAVLPGVAGALGLFAMVPYLAWYIRGKA